MFALTYGREYGIGQLLFPVPDVLSLENTGLEKMFTDFLWKTGLPVKKARDRVARHKESPDPLSLENRTAGKKSKRPGGTA